MTGWPCNRLTANKYTRIDDKGESYPDSKDPPKKDHPQQLLTKNVFTYDVKNLDHIEKRKKSTARSYATSFVPERHKVCHIEIKRNK